LLTKRLDNAGKARLLTERPLVRHDSDLESKAEEAFEQARRYREGILAGFEVASPRYLIIDSADYRIMPSAREEAGVKYDYRNIAVAPSTPSQHATAHPKGTTAWNIPPQKPGNSSGK